MKKLGHQIDKWSGCLIQSKAGVFCESRSKQTDVESQGTAPWASDQNPWSQIQDFDKPETKQHMEKGDNTKLTKQSRKTASKTQTTVYGVTDYPSSFQGGQQFAHGRFEKF